MIDPASTTHPLNGGGATLSRQAHFAPGRMAGSVPVWKTGVDAGASAPRTTAPGDTVQSFLPVRGGGHTPGPAPRMGFTEFLDIINPLHHLPVIGNIYRAVTGDEISSVARIAGGGLYGGPVGAAVSLVSAAMDEHGGGGTPQAAQSFQPADARVQVAAYTRRFND